MVIIKNQKKTIMWTINHIRVSNINNKNINEKLKQNHSYSHNSRTTTDNERFGLMNGIFKRCCTYYWYN